MRKRDQKMKDKLMAKRREIGKKEQKAFDTKWSRVRICFLINARFFVYFDAVVAVHKILLISRA